MLKFRHTPIDHWPCPLRMRTNVFADLKEVRIIEVPDKRGPDNRDCTVVESAQLLKPFVGVILYALWCF